MSDSMLVDISLKQGWDIDIEEEDSLSGRAMAIMESEKQAVRDDKWLDGPGVTLSYEELQNILDGLKVYGEASIIRQELAPEVEACMYAKPVLTGFEIAVEGIYAREWGSAEWEIQDARDQENLQAAIKLYKRHAREWPTCKYGGVIEPEEQVVEQKDGADKTILALVCTKCCPNY